MFRSKIRQESSVQKPLSSAAYVTGESAGPLLSCDAPNDEMQREITWYGSQMQQRLTIVSCSPHILFLLMGLVHVYLVSVQYSSPSMRATCTVASHHPNSTA